MKKKLHKKEEEKNLRCKKLIYIYVCVMRMYGFIIIISIIMSIIISIIMSMIISIISVIISIIISINSIIISISIIVPKSSKSSSLSWQLSLNDGYYAIKIDGGRQTDRKTDGQTDRPSL